LGYDTKDRKITVNEAEADRVRAIFRGYLKLGSLNLMMADLRRRGMVTKVRTLKTGETVGGIPFTRGPLAHLLRNRFYIGEVVFKGETLAGEQPAIVDKGLFEAVQARLTEQVTNHKASRTKSEALLTGRIFDDRGHRMTPSHARRRGIKYRYYISSALLQGRPKQAGTINRIPAPEVEALVIKAVRDRVNAPTEIADTLLIRNHVTRVEVQPDQLVIELTAVVGVGSKRKRKSRNVIEVPWRKTATTRRREILVPESEASQNTRPIRAENRALLVASIARGRRWLDEVITDPTANSERIAHREGCTARKVNMTISLAFLAPDLVKAAICGRLPHGMGVARLCDLPAEWSRQRQVLGLRAV
jgi:site-specific DNA recombinase